MTATYDANMPSISTTKPTRSGYTFAGWYDTSAATGGTQYYTAAGASARTWNKTANTTLYARWTRDSYTISYNLDGGTVATANPTTYNVESAAFTLNNPSKTGYTFAGWTGTGLSSATKTVTIPVKSTGNRSYTANWTANPYTVKLSANGGSGTMADISMTYDVAKTLPACTMTRTGYTFAGWNRAADGSGKSYANGSSINNLATSGSVTLFAQWTANPYTVKFNGNGNTGGTVPSAVPATYDVNFSIPSGQPTKTGYTFKGWSKSSTATTADYAPGSSYKNLVTSGEVTLYAVWAVNSYTLSFDAVGGSPTPKSQTIAFGAKATAPTNPALTGYTFAGWYTGKNGTGSKWDFTSSTMPAADTTLYAKWTLNSYTLTYVSDGVTKQTYQVPYGSKLTGSYAAPSLTKTGYTSQGWLKPDNTAWDFANGTMPASNLTLTASWKANTYQVLFYGNNATGGSMSPQTLTYDKAANLSSNNFLRLGYTFKEWNTTADGTGAKYTNAQQVLNLRSAQGDSIPLYAQWTANTYAIEFVGNGSTSGSMSNLPMTYDVSKTLPANAFARTGYNFAGWNTAADGTGDSYNNNASVKNLAASGTTRLYAQWTLNNYSVTFNANGGTPAPAGQSVGYGKYVTDPGTIARTGYTFKGWYRTSDFSDAAWNFGTDTMPAGSLTLHAKWEANTFNVTLNAGSGVGIPVTRTYTYEKPSQNLPAMSTLAYAKTGYTFKGWTQNPNGTGTLYADGADVATGLSTGTNVTLYAQWTPNTYTVSFNANTGDQNTVPPSLTNAVYDAAVTLPSSVPAKKGYTFKEWNTAADGSGTSYAKSATVNKLNLTAQPNGMGVLYAQWTANAYSIAFEGNNNTSGSMANLPMTYDAAKNLPANAFARTGYTFKEWNTVEGGTGTSYADKASVKNLATSGTAKLYAQWTPNSYTISFDGNGHDGGTVPASVSATYDAVVNMPADVPTRTGYTFKGWARTANATKAEFEANAATASAPNLTADVNGSAKLYAVWGINQYTVSFEANGGSAVSSQTLDYQALVDESKASTARGGYTFQGWFADSDLKTAWNFAADKVPAKDMKLYAKWKANAYTVKYAANYLGATQLPVTQGFVYDEAQTLTANAFKRTGYTFAGWALEPAGDVLYRDKQPNVKNVQVNAEEGDEITLYAQWVAKPYMMLFMANYPTSSIDNGEQTFTASYTYDETYNLPDVTDECLFACPGYDFIGWNTAADGSGVSYTNAEAVTNLTTGGVFMLYAQWRGGEYTLAFDGNAGSDVVKDLPDALTMHVGQGATLSEAKPTRDGWAFSEWNTEPDGSGDAYAPGAFANNLSSTVGATAKLYAQWIPVISVDAPGDSSLMLTADAATGTAVEATASQVSFKSQTPVPVRVSTVKCVPVDGQTELVFPDKDRWSDVKVSIDAGGQNKDVVGIGRSHAFVEGEAPAFVIGAGTEADPGKLDLQVSFDLSSDIDVRLRKDPVHAVTVLYTYETVKEG